MTHTDLQGLLARLRKPIDMGRRANRDGDEAADAIEALLASLTAKDAEIAELKHEAELFDESRADQNRMVDRIADLIGLPHDQELDTTAFELWLSKINQSAEHADRVIAGLNKQLTEQFELSTKYVALSERYREALAPFAKAGTLFEREPEDPRYQVVIYNPAAGDDFKITDRHLRAAALALHENPESKA